MPNLEFENKIKELESWQATAVNQLKVIKWSGWTDHLQRKLEEALRNSAQIARALAKDSELVVPPPRKVRASQILDDD
jgi:hypothetical protein